MLKIKQDSFSILFYFVRTVVEVTTLRYSLIEPTTILSLLTENL